MNSITDSIKKVKSLRNMKSWEIILLVLFIIYIIFPFQTPASLASLIESPLGIIVLFCVILYLFIYTNPILGVIYIFVAYELLRRSSITSGRVSIIDIQNQYPTMNVPTVSNQVPDVNTTRTTRTLPSSQLEKDVELQTMNINRPVSLEEEVISIAVPSNQNQANAIKTEHNFLPVADTVLPGASMYM